MQFGHFESAEGVGPKGLGSLAQCFTRDRDPPSPFAPMRRQSISEFNDST